MKKILGIILIIIGIMTTALGIILKVKGQMSVSVTGGADGLTSIFVAGKVGNTSVIIEMIVGSVLFVIGICMIGKKNSNTDRKTK